VAFRSRALLFPFPPSRVGGWLEAPRDIDLSMPRSTSVPGSATSRSPWVRSTRSSMALRVHGGSSRSLAVPVAPSPSCDLRSAQVTGRLQGLAPPTSPVEFERVLQRANSLFLPWVFLPFEALSRLRPEPSRAPSSTPGLPEVHPRTGFRFALRARGLLLERLWTAARSRLFDVGGCNRRRSRPPWGFIRQRATVTT